MLQPQDCELFDQPYFQFAQWKKYQPEKIPELKARYQNAWQNWKALHLALARELGEPYAPPHIERWSNGWQMRAHFFAYYKYEYWQNSAAILSVILNRRRLQVSLDWHCYREDRSAFNLTHYNQWLDAFDRTKFADFELWHGKESEYADYATARDVPAETFIPQTADDFWCIGRNLEKAELAQQDSFAFIFDSLQRLRPLYEACHR